MIPQGRLNGPVDVWGLLYGLESAEEGHYLPTERHFWPVLPRFRTVINRFQALER